MRYRSPLATLTLLAASAALGTALTAADADPALAPSDKAAPGLPMSISTDADARLDPTFKADQAYIGKALTMTMVSVASARMALAQADFPANVRHAAQCLLDDGTALEGQLRTLALQQGFVVPATLTSHDRRKLDRLGACHGLRFLDAWVSLQISEHDGAISLFSGEARHSADHELAAFASHQLPTLESDRALLGRLPFGDDQDDWWRYWQRDDTADMAPPMPGHLLTQ